MATVRRDSAMFLEASGRLLEVGHQVRFRAEGTSMQPAIQDGDAVTVAPVDPQSIREGDVVLFQQDRRPIAHRVAEVRQVGGQVSLVTRGDRKAAPDAPVHPNQILGKVVFVERAARGPQPSPSGVGARVKRAVSRLTTEIRARVRVAVPLMVVGCWLGGAPAAQAQMVTGIYTGNNTDGTAITQLGFLPDVVIIKADDTGVAVIRTSTMSGDLTKPMTGTAALASNMIQSLDDTNGGGFTIGTHANVNKSAVNYYFAAFQAVSGQVELGTYTGTGSAQSIGGLTFSPAMVLVMAATADGDPVFRTTASTSSCDTDNAACNTTTYITSLDSNGFTVGTANYVNRSGKGYHFVAFKQVSTQFAVGTYSGNGTDLTSIPVGFEPEYLWVRNIGTNDAIAYPASLGPTVDDTLYFKNVANQNNRIQQLESNGFQVGTDNDANGSGQSYIWVAWGRQVATAVKLASMSAVRYDKATLLEWRTGWEVDNLGFHVYREQNGVRARITPGLVAGSGLLVGRGKTSNAGHAYGWWDAESPDSANRVAYWLEDVDLNGKTTLHGPIVPKQGGPRMPAGVQSKLLKNLGRPPEAAPKRGRGSSSPPDPSSVNWNSLPSQPVGTGSALASAAALTTASSSLSTAPRLSATAVATGQTIAGAPAIKLSVKADGWYRVTLAQLAAAGLPPAVRTETLQLFADGIEQPMKVSGGGIEFYGRGVDTPYTDTRVYWLIWGRGVGKRVGSATAGKSALSAAFSFPFTVEYKDRSIFFAALQNGEAENFFGELITTEPTDVVINVTHLDPASAVATLEVVMQGVTEAADAPGGHIIAISVNGNAIGEMTFTGREHPSKSFVVPASYLVEGDNIVTLVAGGGDADVTLVDVMRLVYWHTYAADGDRLRFSAQGHQAVTVGGFSSSAVRLVDITDPLAVVEIRGRVSASGGGYQVSFQAPGSGARTLVAFTAPLAPAEVRANRPSSWFKAEHAADYVVISHGDFISALGPLEALREGQGRSVAIVDVEDLFDEFSFGQKTPFAIRDFVARAKAAWRVGPKFLVLAGNATNDPRNYLGTGEPDYLPTKFVSTRAFETASDDWFVDLNGDSLPDLAIGRLPARSLDDASAIVAKIVAYERADAGVWSRSMSFVADASEEQDFDFAGASNRVSQLVPPGYAVNKIFRGELGTEGAKTTLLGQLNAGQAIVNYAGHASVQIWHDDLLTTDDVPMLGNGSRLPVFVMMGCLNGFFHSLFPEESLAESLVRAPAGGAVAVWASSGFTEADDQFPLDHAFFQLAFDRRYPTLGEVAAAAKAAARDKDVRVSWIFFGDPATRLKGLPEAAAPAAGSPVSTQSSQSTPESSPAGGADGAASAASRSASTAIPVRLQDWNADGRADIFLTATASWRAIFAAGVRSGTWGASWEVHPADLNGDGVSDAVLYDRQTGAWAQALNRGSARFTFTFGLWGSGWEVHVADLTGDGKDDVLLSNRVSGLWFEALNDGEGYFHYVPGSWTPGSAITLADFSGDGVADAFLYNPETGAWSIAYNAGEGYFTSVSGSLPPGYTVRVANLNGDALADLFFYDAASGGWQQCVTQTAGQLSCSGGTAAAGAKAVLLRGESGDDALLYNPTTGAATMILHRAGVTEMVGAAWAPGLAVATGDLNGDGRGDIVLYDPASGAGAKGLARGAAGQFDFSAGRWGAGWTLVGKP